MLLGAATQFLCNPCGLSTQIQNGFDKSGVVFHVVVNSERKPSREQAEEFSKMDRVNARIEAKGINVRIQGVQEIRSQSGFLPLVEMESPPQIGQRRGLDRGSQCSSSRS